MEHDHERLPLQIPQKPNFIPLLIIIAIFAIVVKAILSWIPTTFSEAVRQYYTSAEYASPDGVLMIPVEDFDELKVNELFFKNGFSNCNTVIILYNTDLQRVGEISYSNDGKLRIADKLYSVEGIVSKLYPKR